MDKAQHSIKLRLAAVLILCLPVVLALGLLPGSAAAQQPRTAADADPPAQYARIGVVPLTDEGNIRDGALMLAEMLAGRLTARYEQVEFVLLELDDNAGDGEPLLLDAAVALGAEHGVEALLDGVFLGVEIVGGTWPNQGSDLPMARGMLRWRVVDCGSGLLALDGKVMPKKPKCYPMSVRTEDELISRVLQDVVAAVGDQLEAGGILAGIEPPAPEGQDDEAAETQEP